MKAISGLVKYHMATEVGQKLADWKENAVSEQPSGHTVQYMDLAFNGYCYFKIVILQ